MSNGGIACNPYAYWLSVFLTVRFWALNRSPTILRAMSGLSDSTDARKRTRQSTPKVEGSHHIVMLGPTIFLSDMLAREASIGDGHEMGLQEIPGRPGEGRCGHPRVE